MKLGSLCSGYGGLDLAVEWVFGAETIWHAENAAAPAAVLAARWPGVPNHGDIARIDWTAIEPIDILTAGYPCQPFSVAGRRKGADDDRHLWPYVREAIRHLRPRITVLENVAGHRSLGFDRVLGDLAEDGLHVRWTCLRASDVGACHARTRLFVACGATTTTHTAWDRCAVGLAEPARPQHGGTPPHGDPTAAVAAGAGRPRGPQEWVQRKQLGPVGTLVSLSADDTGFDWGEYGPAIDRWAAVLGRRPARPVVKSSRPGVRSLSPRFVEWMMGLPAGWVTDVQGITRRQMMEALGNGVVPQQAEAAIRALLSDAFEVAA